MAEVKPVGVGTIKKGSYVLMDGEACKIVDLQVSKPGKHGHAKVRMTAVGLLDDKKRVCVMPAHDNIDVPIIEKRNAQILSVSQNTANVMDSETFEIMDMEIPDELKDSCKEGTIVLYWDVMGKKVMKQIKGEES
ncbi:MAG TPA: translation initiation factor IF-5A [Candidatus Woesearchaeota archaeon]|nr:translation initiation factor IF-5A [Candidatus Woesearchaeota archaeon]